MNTIVPSYIPPAARYYNSDLSIWISVDPLSDKYPNLSPYTYCADNPVKLVDPNGREITLETIYKKDANGNDTKEIERYNIRITGKIYNLSRIGINVEDAKKQIISQIESSFSGETETGIPVTTTADFEIVDSYSKIQRKDHIILLSNGVDISGNVVYGKVDKIGGRTAYVDANLFTGISGLLTNRGAKTAAHEVGHLLGLKHCSAIGFFNLMRGFYTGGSRISSKQLSSIINTLKKDSVINIPKFKRINNFN